MICFVWDGLPQYAARCIGEFVKRSEEKVAVVATRPQVPVTGMERLCGCDVVWIDYDESRTLREILGEIPEMMVVSGWGVGAFNRFRDEVHSGGGRVIAMCDNNWTGISLKVLLNAIRFRLCVRGKYEGYFVPGRSGTRLLKFYGVDSRKIATGIYSADSSLFRNGPPLNEREKKIIFVGQFIERKNVRRLVAAFTAAALPGWRLEMYGSGPLHEEITRIAERFNSEKEVGEKGEGSRQSIRIHPFVQPEELAALYRTARIFVLPSLEEHWGLVVHEAALSGCVLLLGEKTGAAADLLGKSNGFSFDPFSEESIRAAIEKGAAMDEASLLAAQKESLELSSAIGLGNFAESVMRFREADG